MKTSPDLRVLIIGSGGREHALLKACLVSPRVADVIVAPGNGGMEAETRCLPLEVSDVAATVALARAEERNFVIVGPEVPLAVGVADALRAAGLAVYGPGAKGAELEASKAVCKDFFARHRIPTAAYATFTSPDAALAHLAKVSYPTVVKASGLAAGKGVIISPDRAGAEQAVRDMMQGRVFGESGATIVIEDFLEGEEASIMVVVSDGRYVCLPASQDHKRIGDGDTGPNTGGMGAYAPAAVVTPALQREIEQTIIEPTLRGFAQDGIAFRGTLFIGLMIGPRGPKVLEFNCRFGDPETQVLLPLLASDPVDLLHAAATGTLDPAQVRFKDGYAMIVVLAAQGYPDAYPKGSAIGLPTSLPPGVQIVHAGTRRDADGTIRSAGGRVLGVVAQAQTLRQAADLAYAVCPQVRWEHAYYRRDIAARQLRREG